MSVSTVTHLKTPYRDAKSAMQAFIAIKKAEGSSPVTIKNYEVIIGLFLREHPEFLKAPREALLAFVSEPENRWSRFTRLKTIKVFGLFLVEEGLLEQNPSRGIKAPMPQERVDIPSLEDVKAFIAALNDKSFSERRLKVIIYTALDTGLRRGELCGLRIDDFDGERLLLRIAPETSKTRNERVVPISPQTAREIRRFIGFHRQEWRCSWIFPTDKGTKMSPSNLGLHVRRVSDRVGYRLKLHGLRHLCATEFLRETGNIVLTAQLLGHSSITTTSRFYEHLTIDDLQEAHGKASVVSGVLDNRRKTKV